MTKEDKAKSPKAKKTKEVNAKEVEVEAVPYEVRMKAVTVISRPMASEKQVRAARRAGAGRGRHRHRHSRRRELSLGGVVEAVGRLMQQDEFRVPSADVFFPTSEHRGLCSEHHVASVSPLRDSLHDATTGERGSRPCDVGGLTSVFWVPPLSAWFPLPHGMVAHMLLRQQEVQALTVLCLVSNPPSPSVAPDEEVLQVGEEGGEGKDLQERGEGGGQNGAICPWNSQQVAATCLV